MAPPSSTSGYALVAPRLKSTPPPCASLYVGDLQPTVEEEQLRRFFYPFGSLHSVRICRYVVGGVWHSYAYVNFLHKANAIRAQRMLNQVPLLGKPMRIMWSKRDPMQRKTGDGNVFVKNLDESVTGRDLDRLFSKYGMVLSTKVVMEGEKCKGYGFVQFEKEEQAQAAIRALNGTPFPVGGGGGGGGKRLYVTKFVRKSERKSQSQGSGNCNVYVKNLDHNISSEILREKFSSFGQIQSAAVMKDVSGMPKGFGFVSFRTNHEAMNAIDAMHGSKLGSKVLYVCMAQKKQERQQQILKEQQKMQGPSTNRPVVQKSNVYVKNLDESINDPQLKRLFSFAGEIQSAKVARDEYGRSKGFGFVSFYSPQAAQRAIKAMHHYMVIRKPLYVTLAMRKEERARYLEQKFAQRDYVASLQNQYSCYPAYDTALYQQSANAYPIPQLDLVQFQYPQMMIQAQESFTTGNTASGWWGVPQYLDQQHWL